MGINEENVKEYWDKRASAQGAQTTGFNNIDLAKQDENYKIRTDFIFETCPMDKKTLDYGCGTGRYTDMFGPEYCGADITSSLLLLAKEGHPDSRYVLLDNPVPKSDQLIGQNFELFFTATVLQHCSEELVDKIIREAVDLMADKAIFFFYENDQTKAHHVQGRDSLFYLNMVKKHVDIVSFGSRSHVIHKEKHTSTFIDISRS